MAKYQREKCVFCGDLKGGGDICYESPWISRGHSFNPQHDGLEQVAMGFESISISLKHIQEAQDIANEERHARGEGYYLEEVVPPAP
jgi:hypothetical protein